ncbi:hypothetical protein CPB86DRAFT_829150 [Serendipita vermifera]|nr:hypothetical protein CPB86DRAFT_829150 [Serendipita vermifera]
MSQSVVKPDNSFDKFADEIIEIIVEYLDLGDYHKGKRDVHRFASCERRIRRIALPVLYHEIILNNSIEMCDFYQYLLDFPQYAPLVKAILLIGDDEDEWALMRRYKMPKYAVFRRIIGDARNRSLPPVIIGQLERKACWAIALCLLTLLPKLEGFTLSPGNVHHHIFNAYSALIFHPHYFSPSLHWVSLKGDLSEWDPYRLGNLEQLFSFPSITKISAEQLESDPHTHSSDYSGLPPSAFDNPHTDHRSAVETLQLYDSSLSEHTLTTLLRRPKTLKSLVYVNGTGHRNRLSLIQFQKTIDHVSSTLNTLIIQFDDGLLQPVQGLSFAHFTVLKRLSINYRLLFGRNAGDIVERLPLSLEILVLWVGQFPTPGDIKAREFIETLLTAKSSTALHHLRTTAVSSKGQFYWKPFEDLAREKGVGRGDGLIPAD